MRVSRFVAAVSLAVCFLGCGSQGSSTGKITVLLKDAPADFHAAVVTIAEVDLVGPGGSVVLTTAPVTTDLLTLASDVQALVSGAVIPAGPYSQLRFVITGAYLDVAGAVYASPLDYAGLPAGVRPAGELQMPSYAQSGLKVILPEGFTVGSDSVLVVDFDVSQSFGHDTGSGAWVMHPVIKAEEPQALGSVHVTLALAPEAVLPTGYALTDFQAVLSPTGTTDTTPAKLEDPGATGTAAATFPYLAPGDYDVTLEAPPGMTFTTSPIVPATVTVAPGQMTSADFLLESAFVAE